MNPDVVVDWSIAPEGATLYFPDNDEQFEAWGKVVDGEIFMLSEAAGEPDWFPDDYVTEQDIENMVHLKRPA